MLWGVSRGAESESAVCPAKKRLLMLQYGKIQYGHHHSEKKSVIMHILFISVHYLGIAYMGNQYGRHQDQKPRWSPPWMH